MTTQSRVVIAVLLVLAAALFIACSSSKPKVETTPAVEEPEPTPTPLAEPIPEEVIEAPVTESITSEEVAEELPEDIVALNARGYLEDTFFATDSFDLDEAARGGLARNAGWLREYPSVKILIEGHCDERNTREYNLALGERRASRVRDYLVFLGIAPQRISIITYGKEKPFALGHDESVWRLNRRAHFVITAR